MRILKALLLGSATFAATCAASGSAQAQSYAFGAGSSSLQIVFRHTMDCMYDQAQGSPGSPGRPDKPGPLAKAANCSGFNTSGVHGMILYAPTGSGNGKLVLRANDPAQIGSPSNSVPYTSWDIGVGDVSPRGDLYCGKGNSCGSYDGVQFIGSTDVVNSDDMTAWTDGGTTSAQSLFGNLIQIPVVAEALALGFNGKDGTGAVLDILPDTPTGGTSGLNLSRHALCGIVSGHITRWDNPILTALNGGVLGTGNITFVHRGDASGETFLLSNALVAQCRYEFGPNNETDATVVSYAFPWTDRAQACTAPLIPRGAALINWPDQFPFDQCGNTVGNPGGGHFADHFGPGYGSPGGTGGAGDLVAFVNITVGAIGFAAQNFWLPVHAGGAKTANLQSQWDITASTGAFQPPTLAGAQRAMKTAIPQFDATTRANPLTWSLQGVNPNPVVTGAYPISGFGWIEMYQCYQMHTLHPGTNPYLWFKNWLDFMYGFIATGIMIEDGFAQVPSVWQTEIYALLNDPVNGPQGSGCTGKVGAY